MTDHGENVSEHSFPSARSEEWVSNELNNLGEKFRNLARGITDRFEWRSSMWPRTRRTRTTCPSNRSFLTGCSDRKAAGPSATLHRSTGLSRKQIRARRRFTTVLRQSRLRTTVCLISAIAGKPALILIKSVCRFSAIFIQMQYPEMRHGIHPQSAKVEAKSERH